MRISDWSSDVCSSDLTAEGDAALTVLRDGVSETIVAERLLVAAGRTPNVEDLGLTEAGVTQTPSGAILVDDRMRTSVHGVYAAGDVTGRDQFVYMAAYGAKIAAKKDRKSTRLNSSH